MTTSTARTIHQLLLTGAITCPVLLVHGKESWMANPEEDGRAALFSNSRTVTFEGAGHWGHHDQTVSILEILKAFI